MKKARFIKRLRITGTMAAEEEEVKTGEEPQAAPTSAGLPRPAGPTVGPGLLRMATVYFGVTFILFQGQA